MTFEVALHGLLGDDETTADLVADHFLDDAVCAALGDVQHLGDLGDGEEAGHDDSSPRS